MTLVGNGRLEPVGVTESKDRPRRLVLDFPNTSSTTPSQVAVDSPLVSRVRVAINSHQPLVTRVVMEIAPNASYHVENAGEGGRDVAVVFEQARPANTVVMTPAEVSGESASHRSRRFRCSRRWPTSPLSPLLTRRRSRSIR